MRNLLRSEEKEVVAENVEMTGIEKQELAEAMEVEHQRTEAGRERRKWAEARIGEIRAKCGAELQELAMLEDELMRYRQYFRDPHGLYSAGMQALAGRR